MKKNKHIKIIGIDEGGKNTTLPQIKDIILKSPLLIGGERQLDIFPDYTGKKMVIKNKLADLVNAIKNENQDTVVLASGDPLFFGIGGYLLSQFADSQFNIEILPAISSLQLAFARAGLSWQDARNISLHGRKIDGLAQKIYSENKISLLTDAENHPGKIAAYLLHFNLPNYDAFVAENLGLPNERVAWYSLEELSKKESADFSELNVLILTSATQTDKIQHSFGIADDEFSYPQKPDGLITKREIRILSLSAMNLNLRSVVWDIGSCTGSVAIEAARIAREGQIFAIEKNAEHITHCRKNSKKFHTDINIIEGTAPDAIQGLPEPDAVFIGGSGGKMEEILDICAIKLRPVGRIVINAATLETLQESSSILKKAGFEITMEMTQISRSRAIAGLTRFQALNPVFILTACRTIPQVH